MNFYTMLIIFFVIGLMIGVPLNNLIGIGYVLMTAVAAILGLIAYSRRPGLKKQDDIIHVIVASLYMGIFCINAIRELSVFLFLPIGRN